MPNDPAWQGLIWRQSAGKEWSPEARLLGAYLLSGPAANRIGCFPLDMACAARETGLPADRIIQILAELAGSGFVHADHACGWVWMPEILRQHPFADTEEVRRALPELAAVPRGAAFHGELIGMFRASADRPGKTAAEAGRSRAAELAQQWSLACNRARTQLPGLPSLGSTRLQPIAKLAICIGDYSRRWKVFLLDIVNTHTLRLLGLLAVLSAILFVVFPGIDIGVAGWFYDPPRDFALGASWIGRFFDNQVHYAMEWFLVLFVGAFIYGLVRRKPVLGLTPKRFLYVALSIGLSAGLLTNVVLKDSWGRARPSQIAEFGGPKQFTPPFMRSSQCDKNCSFVSGDASLAASFMAFAVIAERNRRRWWAGLGLFTAIVGVMRMARGSHFLSDVVFAVIFTLMIVLALARLIMEGRWRNWPRLRST